jgi:hypothetical protein
MRTAYYFLWFLFITNTSLLVYSFFIDKKSDIIKPAPIVWKIDTLSSDTTKLLKDTADQGSLSMLKDIDSAYTYSVKIDSLERQQFKLIISGEDENYIKLNYNRIQGKINTYEYKLVGFLADAHNYLCFSVDRDVIWKWMMKGKNNRTMDKDFPEDNTFDDPWTVDKYLIIDSL